MNVEIATPADTDAIQAVFHSRPGADNGGWKAPKGTYFVARDGGTIAAFLILNVDHYNQEVVAEQFEIEHDDGRPTDRGLWAGRRLIKHMHDEADKLDYDVFAVVALGNGPQERAMLAFEYGPTATVFKRPRKGVRTRAANLALVGG
jgi:hypothetical protein